MIYLGKIWGCIFVVNPPLCPLGPQTITSTCGKHPMSKMDSRLKNMLSPPPHHGTETVPTPVYFTSLYSIVLPRKVALKGLNITAQGNALGVMRRPTISPSGFWGGKFCIIFYEYILLAGYLNLRYKKNRETVPMAR